jgi:hypothetical protein
MAYIAKRLYKKSNHHAMDLSVLLPGYCCRGNYHGRVYFEATVEDERLMVWLTVCGEDYKPILSERYVFLAEDLFQYPLSDCG